MQCGVVRFFAVLCCVVGRGVVQCGVVWFFAVLCGGVVCGEVWCGSLLLLLLLLLLLFLHAYAQTHILEYISHKLYLQASGECSTKPGPDSVHDNAGT